MPVLKNKLTRSAVPVLAILALLLLGAQPKGQTHAVTIQGMQFSPAAMQIKAGDTVIWTNADDRDHTVIATDGSFNSGNLPSGQSFQHQFPTPGNFSYFCKYHPRMKGTIIVAAK
jgi:plastocyanin